MACPPMHITGLSVDGDGWIAAPKNDAGPAAAAKPGSHDEKNDGGANDRNADEKHRGRSVEMTPSCRRLLRATKLDPSDDFFSSADAATETPPKNVEDLVHAPALANLLLKVIADVRRLGSSREVDSRRKGQKEGGDGGGAAGKNGRSGRRRRNGKVAQLEEQRRLRQQQERQKLDGPQKGEDDGEEAPAAASGAGDDGGGDDRADDSTDATDGIPPELRLPAVFNTVRVLISLLRPMLDHPRRNDATLRMKNGPSIKTKGKAHRYYLISDRVYSCVSAGCWNELHREYNNKLLNETKEGLAVALSRRKDDPPGRYELSGRDFVASLFRHESYRDHKVVAEKCMGLLETKNATVVLKLDDALTNLFEKEHNAKQSALQRSIDKLQDKLTHAISRRFRGVRLTVYGSCLSGLALEGSHDVDVSIFIPELDRLKRDFDDGAIAADEYEKKMRRIIFQVRDQLNYSRRFVDLFAVTRARVPVIKGTDPSAGNPYTHDGALSFDLCFLNDIAVVNSSLLREYSLFDNRARLLMLAVKSFAKTGNVASAADGTLSSYSWLNLCVFYLQCIGFLPALQCPRMMEEHGFRSDLGNPWHNVNGLRTSYLTKDLVTTKNVWERRPFVKDANLSMLLYGFLNFYAEVFPQQTVAASIRFGNCTLQKTSFRQSSKLWRMCIEDPLETCDSHAPHDLGCHISEDGQKKINGHLMGATRALAELLQLETVRNDEVLEFTSKWIRSAAMSSGNDKKATNNAGQPNQRRQKDAKPQNNARGDARRGRPQNGGPGRGNLQNSKDSRRNHPNSGNAPNDNKQGRGDGRQNGDAVSTYISARSQMRNGAGGAGGKRAKDKPNSKFARDQKERHHEMTEEKSRTPNAKRKTKKKHGNSAQTDRAQS